MGKIVHNEEPSFVVLTMDEVINTSLMISLINRKQISDMGLVYVNAYPENNVVTYTVQFYDECGDIVYDLVANMYCDSGLDEFESAFINKIKEAVD